MSIEKEIQELFISRNWTLALAESCTGGKLSATLVQNPGASNYFLGSIVAYSNAAKETLLSVSHQTLQVYGAVSKEAAEQMAKGALSRFQSDFSLSTTGIAGPDGGSTQKPVGTVCFAIVQKEGGVHSWKEIFSGSREEIIKKSSSHALQELFKFVKSL